MSDYTPTTDEFESLADWIGEQDWAVNVRDYTDEYVTHVREQPVELLAERLMQSSWLAEHDAKVRAEALREAQLLLALDGFFCPALDERIEKEAGLK